MTDIRTPEGREELRRTLAPYPDADGDCIVCGEECGEGHICPPGFQPAMLEPEDVYDAALIALGGLDIAQEMARLLRLLTACHYGLPNLGCTYCDILIKWDNWQKEKPE